MHYHKFTTDCDCFCHFIHIKQRFILSKFLTNLYFWIIKTVNQILINSFNWSEISLNTNSNSSNYKLCKGHQWQTEQWSVNYCSTQNWQTIKRKQVGNKPRTHHTCERERQDEPDGFHVTVAPGESGAQTTYSHCQDMFCPLQPAADPTAKAEIRQI